MDCLSHPKTRARCQRLAKLCSMIPPSRLRWGIKVGTIVANFMVQQLLHSRLPRPIATQSVRSNRIIALASGSNLILDERVRLFAAEIWGHEIRARIEH